VAAGCLMSRYTLLLFVSRQWVIEFLLVLVAFSRKRLPPTHTFFFIIINIPCRLFKIFFYDRDGRWICTLILPLDDDNPVRVCVARYYSSCFCYHVPVVWFPWFYNKANTASLVRQQQQPYMCMYWPKVPSVGDRVMDVVAFPRCGLSTRMNQERSSSPLMLRLYTVEL
jgi:hypothetical protein